MQYKDIENFLFKKNYTFKNYESVSSTMDIIKELINEKEELFFVTAEKQIKGKGRRGNHWQSPRGNIYASFNLKMINNIHDHFIFNIITALSICDTLSLLFDIKTEIKWPNDIYINRRKISGIITEIFNNNKNNQIIIGFGINVATSPLINNYPTISTKEINEKINKIEIIKSFINIFFNNYLKNINLERDSLLDNFKNKLLYLNEEIHLELPDKSYSKGKFEDINIDGSMKININGMSQNIYSARIVNDSN